MQEIIVNLTCINRSHVYTEHKSWSQGDPVQTGMIVNYIVTLSFHVKCNRISHEA